MTIAPNVLRLWIAEVSLGNRKTCPNCHGRLNDGDDTSNSIVSVGYYHAAKYCQMLYCCRDCFVDSVEQYAPYKVQVRSGCKVRWYRGE